MLPLCNMVAQEIDYSKCNFSFNALTENVEYNDTCVQDSEGIYHAISGVQRVIELHFDKYAIEGVYNPIVKLKDTNQAIDVVTEGNKLFFEVKNSGEYTLASDSIKLKSSELERDTVLKEVVIDNFSILLHKPPQITRNTVEDRKREVIWNDNVRELLVECQEGYPSGWSQTWMLGQDVVGEGTIWKGVVNTIGLNTLTLKVKNISPDGKTPWFEHSYSCEFSVYERPGSVKLMFKRKECPSELNLYCEDNDDEKISISLSKEEGYEWKYQWIQHGKIVSEEKEYRPSMNDDEVSSYEQGAASEYRVDIESCPQGMADSLKHTTSISGIVKFWKTPQIKISYDDCKVVFEGTDVNVDINVVGGIPGDEYHWKLNGTENIFRDRLTFKSKMSDKNKEAVMDEQNHTLSTIISNEYTSVEVQETIALTVWKNPEVTPMFVSNNNALNGSHTVEDTIYVCERFGGNIELFLDKKLGDERGWSYYWTDLNDVGSSVMTTSSVLVPITGIGEIKYMVQYINRPEGMIESHQYERSENFIVKVCPTPSIDLEGIKSVYAGKHGDQLTLELGNNATGIGGKWIYQWQKDGDKEPLEDKTTTLYLINTTDSVTSEGWMAKPIYCGPLGDVWYGDAEGESKSFSVNIYPQPTEKDLNIRGFDKSRLDAFYEGERSYDIGFEGKYHYAESWVYEIKYNDETKVMPDTVSSVSPVSFSKLHTITPDPIVDGSPSSKTEVFLSVKCLVRDEEADTTIVVDSVAKSLDYYAWRKGEVKQEEYPKYTYFGDKEDLRVNTSFGYENDGSSTAAKGGWEYEWTLDGAVVGNGESYPYECKNEASARSLEYVLRCKNVLNGEVGTDSTFSYKFEEYAKIEEEIRVEEPYDENVREGDLLTIKAIGNLKKGNPEGWFYKWERDDDDKWDDVDMVGIKTEIPAKDFECLMKSSGNRMETEKVIYKLSCYNYAPDDKYLGKMDREFLVKIHRKPKITGFREKGNGTSNIYIAVSPSPDAKFEFGYGNQPHLNADAEEQYLDGVGSDDVIQHNEKDNHYYAAYRYSSSPTQPWTRTFWDYDDGFRCYSDVRSVEVRGLSYSRVLKIEDGYFFVNLEEEMPATVVLHSLDGKLVWKHQYVPQKDYYEHLDFEGIVSGVYILRCVVGEQQVVRKIVVR